MALRFGGALIRGSDDAIWNLADCCSPADCGVLVSFGRSQLKWQDEVVAISGRFAAERSPIFVRRVPDIRGFVATVSPGYPQVTPSVRYGTCGIACKSNDASSTLVDPSFGVSFRRRFLPADELACRCVQG